MGDDVIIRPFVLDDYEAMTAVWEEAGLPYKPNGRDRRENIAREIEADTAMFLAAESNGRMVGVVMATHDGRKGWINRLAVIPEFRRKGVARLLVERAEEVIYQKGIEIVACLIEDYNTSSMEFFQELGYHKHTDAFYFSKRKHPGV